MRKPSERYGDWFATYTGVQFYPLDPRPEEISIVDIAHALSNQCRFAGHTDEFYSVAQHCLHVSELVPPAFARWGLLHDAAEAYLVDVPKPIKHDPAFAFYREAERRVMAALCTRYHLDLEEPPEVKIADTRMLVTERRDLRCHAPPPAPWREDERKIEPFSPQELLACGSGVEWDVEDDRILGETARLGGLSPANARAAFIERFYELFPEEGARDVERRR